MSRWMRTALTALATVSLLYPLAGCNPCEDDGTLTICGDFGDLTYAVQLPAVGNELRWPAAATENSTLVVATDWEVMELSETGMVSTLGSTFGRSSAPSLAPDGTVFVVSDDGARALSADSADFGRALWSQSIEGGSATTPPAIGQGEVHVATSSNDRQDRTLMTLDAESGDVRQVRYGVSPTAVGSDGSLRYLEGPEDCGARFDAVVAEMPDGEVRWRHGEDSGIRDFAPGPDGEVYIVTGDRELRRLSEGGSVVWSFTPDCQDCNVAAAPTVTETKVYFPVWQGWSPNPGCDEPEPDVVTTASLDPLYALNRDGDHLWTYDGFDTISRRPSQADTMGGVLMLGVDKTRHHPSGRPAVAEDGTLFVATDGAIVALNPDGEQIGYAVFEPSAGEMMSGDGGTMLTSTWLNSGVTPAPVLGPDGSLYMWDGTQIRAFETRRQAANIPWGAPFGGYRNAGRVGG